MVNFPITRSGRVEKSPKKKKKKIFLKHVLPCGYFIFPVIKRVEKVTGFVFFRKGRGKI